MTDVKPYFRGDEPICSGKTCSFFIVYDVYNNTSIGFCKRFKDQVCRGISRCWFWYTDQIEKLKEALYKDCTAASDPMPCECTKCKLKRAEAELEALNTARQAFHKDGGLGYCPTCHAAISSSDKYPERDAIKCVEELQERVVELEEECSRLAGGACPVKNGLVGDEYGNFYCRLKKEFEEHRESRITAEEVEAMLAEAREKSNE